MATYTTTLTLNASATIIDFEVASLSPLPPAQIELAAVLYNTILSTDYDFSSTLFPDINQVGSPPYTVSLTSTDAGFGSVYNDGVYRYYGGFADGISVDYESNAYLLNTTAIDAGILALPITTPAEIARKAYVVSLRAQIDTYFNAANYSATNNYIQYVEVILLTLNSTPQSTPSLLVKTTSTLLTASVTAYEPGQTTVLEGGWYNILTNTLTSVQYSYTWNWSLPIGGTKNITNPSDFPDGVYLNYISEIWAGLLFSGDPNSKFSNVYEGNAYELVTTTIDNQIQLLEDEYDPNNTAEAIALAELQSLQTQIAAAYADEDYILTNALIEQAQTILNNGVSRSISAALTSDADMSVFFTVPPAMPVGTYTEGAGTITNTLTGVAFTFDGFPLDSTDLTQSLNSEELGFGVDFPDGVYQIVVTWLVDGLLFTAECYLVVTTDWQCCIDKAAGKKCGKLNTALMQANLTNAVRMVALYSDVNTANALISEGNRECSTCGCGCS